MSSLSDTIEVLLDIDGAICAAVVDSSNGMILAQVGSGVDMEITSAGNADVLRAKNKTIAMLNLDDAVDDILITLGRQYHIIRPLSSVSELFICLVLDVRNSNLALARRKVKDVEIVIQSI